MFEGDLQDGELEIGQVSAYIKEVMPAAAVVDEIWKEFLETKKRLEQLPW
jgi:enoyl-[acyl-carrier protein] reductase II